MADDPTTLDIYWRPGCGYCTRLFARLESAGVGFRRLNIWEDGAAAEFVRAHNRGNETVPTVVVAGRVMTNPAPDELLAELLADAGDGVGRDRRRQGRRSR